MVAIGDIATNCIVALVICWNGDIENDYMNGANNDVLSQYKFTIDTTQLNCFNIYTHLQPQFNHGHNTRLPQ
jgi:hypothetical protein